MFDALWAKGRDWLPRLLALPTGGCADAQIETGDLTLVEGHWDPHEKCLDPPVSLLSWLIRNPGSLKPSSVASGDGIRQRLTQGDPQTVEKALRLLRTERVFPAWYIFEGPTWPDVYLVARDALVVVEGKRTELSPTIETKWLNGRYQIWRHIDAAWELRGKRTVYGFFIVESDAALTDGAVPEAWQKAGQACLDAAVLRASFPHRSAEEVAAISRCYLGVTTWRKICERFDIDWRTLPHEI